MTGGGVGGWLKALCDRDQNTFETQYPIEQRLMLVLYSGSVLLYEMEHRLVSFCEAGGGPGYKTFFAVKFVR